eukprot:410937_1
MALSSETSINQMSDDTILNIAHYLEFVDIIHSFLILNKRFHNLHLNPQLLYSIKDYPFVGNYRASWNLMLKYCSILSTQNKSNTFIYQNIKKIHVWNLEKNDERANIALLFRNLRCLEIVSFAGGVDHSRYPDLDALLDELPIQTHLTSIEMCGYLSLHIYSFFKSKVSMNSLHLLKRLRLRCITLSADLLTIFSKLINLEVFEFDWIDFDQLGVNNYKANGYFMENAFSCWTNIKKLDIFCQDDEENSFMDDNIMYDAYYYELILKIFFSFTQLEELIFAIAPTKKATMNRVLPYFKQFKSLKKLKFIMIEQNIFFMTQVLKMIQQSEHNYNKLSEIELDLYGLSKELDYLMVPPNLRFFKNLVFECLRMVAHTFIIHLPGNSIDDFIHFKYFIKAINRYTRNDINLHTLVIVIYCFDMLFDAFDKFLTLLKRLVKALKKIGCKFVKVKYIYGCDWEYSHEEWCFIKEQMKCIRFEFNYTHPDLTSDVFVVERHLQCSNIKCYRKSKMKKVKICSQCKLRKYCSRKCQKYDWNKIHRFICLKIK